MDKQTTLFKEKSRTIFITIITPNDERLVAKGINYSIYQVLGEFYTHANISRAQLRKNLKISTASIDRALIFLKDNNLIELKWRRCGYHCTEKQWDLTDSGIKLFESI